MGYATPSALAPFSGENIAIWMSNYPNLAGQAENSNYYAEDEHVFVECVGGDKPGAVYRRQIAWNVTSNDMTYIENEDRSAFTVYRIIRHPQPGTLKQVVFLGAVQTVNLPYDVVDNIIFWSKGHRLGDTGIVPLAPCDNVKLVPSDPKRPWTKDILIMANGTPNDPTVSIKYKNDVGPKSATLVSEALYGLLHYTHHCTLRGQTITEIQNKLKYYKDDKWTDRHGDMNLASIACYAELLRSAAFFGPLPNLVYYDCTRDDEPPVYVHTAAAALAMPKITHDTNPGVLAKTDEAMNVYVEKKMEGARNTTIPNPEWVKISNLILKNFVDCIQEETGIEPNSLFLKDFAEIEATRTKALQKARADTFAAGATESQPGQVLLKVEAQHKCKANGPRGITSQEYEAGIESGMLGKLLLAIVEKCSWYLPGGTPSEIAEAVATCYNVGMHHEQLTIDMFGVSEVGTVGTHGMAMAGFDVRCAHGVREVDYETADEKHCEHSNRIIPALINRFTALEDLDKALRIYYACFNMDVRVGAKIKSSMWKNSSGTGITTQLNTIDFAERELETTCVALVFAAMSESGASTARLTHKMFHEYMNQIQKSSRFSSFPDNKRMIHMAYKWIGPKFGDDGLDPTTPYVKTHIWARAMDFVDISDGFIRTLEVKSCVEGDSTEMLSRVYPNPSACLYSYCKVVKALDKLTLAVGGDREKYILKCRGYYTTDRYTPVVGAFLEAAAAMYDFKLSAIDYEDEATMEALYKCDSDLYFKTVNGPFPWGQDAYELCLESFAADYGNDSGEMDAFINTLRSQTTWAGIQDCWLPEQPGCFPSLPKEDPLGVTRVAHRSGEVRLLDMPAKSPAPDGLDDAAGAPVAIAAPSPAPPYRDDARQPSAAPPGAFVTAQQAVADSSMRAVALITKLQGELAALQFASDQDIDAFGKVHCDAIRMHNQVDFARLAVYEAATSNSAEGASGSGDAPPSIALAM